jgi:hypothetical protein
VELYSRCTDIIKKKQQQQTEETSKEQQQTSVASAPSDMGGKKLLDRRHVVCEILAICSSVVEAFALLGYFAA